MRRHKTIIVVENNSNVLISFYPLNVKKINAITEKLCQVAHKNKCYKQFKAGNNKETDNVLEKVAKTIPYLFVDNYINYTAGKDIVNSAIFVPREGSTSIYSGFFENKILNLKKDM